MSHQNVVEEMLNYTSSIDKLIEELGAIGDLECLKLAEELDATNIRLRTLLEQAREQNRDIVDEKERAEISQRFDKIRALTSKIRVGIYEARKE